MNAVEFDSSKPQRQQCSLLFLVAKCDALKLRRLAKITELDDSFPFLGYRKADFVCIEPFVECGAIMRLPATQGLVRVGCTPKLSLADHRCGGTRSVQTGNPDVILIMAFVGNRLAVPLHLTWCT
jgi:hypothetical protein